MAEQPHRGASRREFLRLAAGAAAVAVGGGCSSGSDKPTDDAARTAGVKSEPTLRIAQWNHYVAGYDRWWADEYTRHWGERNGIEVVVDHHDINQAVAHAEAEVATQRGHDIFHLNFTTPAPFEDEVIDHREIVEEVEARVGKTIPLAERSVFNPKTKKYFGFCDFWAPGALHYRSDLWEPTGVRPDSWDDVLAAGSRLKASGYPVGIGMGADAESNLILLGLMHSFGASIQDEDANVVINQPATVEAVKMGASIFRSAMADEVLGWDITSNNRSLASGRASLILNSIAAMRAIESQDPDLARKVQLGPIPEGPGGRRGPYAVGIYMIWKFSPNQEAAKQFLIDLATDYQKPFVQSQFVNLPASPGSVKDLVALVANDAGAQPPGKYGLLGDAADWTTNLGHPGYSNAATDEVVNASVISRMFAAAASGELSADDAVKAAETQVQPIFEKWRERGKI